MGYFSFSLEHNSDKSFFKHSVGICEKGLNLTCNQGNPPKWQKFKSYSDKYQQGYGRVLYIADTSILPSGEQYLIFLNVYNVQPSNFISRYTL